MNLNAELELFESKISIHSIQSYNIASPDNFKFLYVQIFCRLDYVEVKKIRP